MNRLLFEKTGDAVYLSHLDLMRIFQRAFRRADILIWHSQGFSPRAYVSIALPLPVGMASRCEILDFDVEDGSVELTALPERLNAVLPAGIRVLEAYESSRKIKHLRYLAADVTLEYDNGVPENAAARLTELLGRQELIIQKRTKRKELADVDIAPMIKDFSFTETEGAVAGTVTVLAQNPGLNPQLLEKAVARYLPDLTPDFLRVRRRAVLDAEGRDFR